MAETVHDKVREAREAAYREAVLQAAESAFAEKGFAGVKMAEVASRAGLSLGTLYKVFAGKDELHGAIHAWRATDIITWCTQGMAPNADLIEAMLHGVRGYTRFQIAHPEYLQLTLHEVTSWASARSLRLPEQVHAWNQGFQLAVHIFREGVQQGLFVPERPEQHARMMIAILQVVDRGQAVLDEPPVASQASAKRHRLAKRGERQRIRGLHQHRRQCRDVAGGRRMKEHGLHHLERAGVLPAYAYRGVLAEVARSKTNQRILKARVLRLRRAERIHADVEDGKEVEKFLGCERASSPFDAAQSRLRDAQALRQLHLREPPTLAELSDTFGDWIGLTHRSSLAQGLVEID